MSHCYGINSLNHSFNFDNNKMVHLVYAPNGCMKTSFSKTMKYLSCQSKSIPCDQLHRDEVGYEGVVDIVLDGSPLSQKRIFVADGEEDLDSGAVFANFLASPVLKSSYDLIYTALEKKKHALMTKLNSVSRSSNCESELIETFKTREEDTIFSILERLASEVVSGLPYFDVKYNDVFDKNGKVREFIENNIDKLQIYSDQYKTLTNKSTVFRSVDGHSFTTYQASQLEKTIKDGEYFAVQHKLQLYGREEYITSTEDLARVITQEKETILNNTDLRNAYETIANQVEKNKDLRAFKAVIDKNPDWIPELLNYNTFREKVWKGYLAKDELKHLLDEYNSEYKSHKAELVHVLTESNKELERWKDIVDIYNDRFDVPFKVRIDNQRDIILKKEAAKLTFLYKDPTSGGYVPQSKEQIFKILSRGEKRAFHIMQMLFEFESRKEETESSLIVMDDIADSFDYQNKYAIIEYIKDLAEKSNSKFMIIVLTHNFDFYRTVSSRLGVKHGRLWMANRDDSGNIVLNPGQYTENVFVNAFIEHDDDKIFISMIPYVRNLIEYTEVKNSSNFLKLTECMHQKNNTNNITEQDIIPILGNYTKGKGMKRALTSTKVYDIIMNTANSIESEANPDPVLIQNKIVLSMAIRHLAEKYMRDKLIAAGKSEADLETTKAQTGVWTGIYKRTIPNDSNRHIIERVNMMTPEVIHINSFMYEPLIDMSLSHLISLFRDCKNLQ